MLPFGPRFSLFPSLGHYPALGFLFLPPLAIIQPLVLTFANPWLLFSPGFSLFPTLGYYPALGFPLFPTLGYYPALGLYSAGKRMQFALVTQHWLTDSGCLRLTSSRPTPTGGRTLQSFYWATSQTWTTGGKSTPRRRRPLLRHNFLCIYETF